MRKLFTTLAAALLISTAFTAPAHAEPVTLALFGAGWVAANATAAAFVTAAFNIGASLALSGIAYALSGSGKRQAGASAPIASIQVPERSGLIERRIIYGIQTVSGGVFL